MTSRFRPDFQSNTVTDKRTGVSQSYDSSTLTMLAAVLFNNMDKQTNEHWIHCPTCQWEGVSTISTDCLDCGETMTRRTDIY